MFEDQSSAVEKISSMEVGEKEECWEEERKKEKNSVRLPSGYKPRRPTPAEQKLMANWSPRRSVFEFLSIISVSHFFLFHFSSYKERTLQLEDVNKNP